MTCLHGNWKRHLWTTAGWHPNQITAEEMINQTWLLQSPIYDRSVEIPLETNPILAYC